MILIVAFVATIGCKAESPHYVFILPDGYVGWIQVIFDSPGAPEVVVPKHKRFVLRIDKSGVLKTSSLHHYFAFAGSHDEFFYSRLDPKGREVLSPVPSNYYCNGESGLDSCYNTAGTMSDGFTLSRANLGHPNDGTPGNSWFLFVGPPEARAKMAKRIHRAPGEKYQIDAPEDDPHPGMISATQWARRSDSPSNGQKLILLPRGDCAVVVNSQWRSLRSKLVLMRLHIYPSPSKAHAFRFQSEALFHG
jgi:hypothetical protein